MDISGGFRTLHSGFGILGAVRVAGTVFVLAAALSVGAAAPAARTYSPMLRVIDLTPVTVKGLRFKPGERVRVVLSADGRHVRSVRATRNGSFVARFAAVYAELCTAFQLRATGSSGAVAFAVRKPPLQCAALDPVP